MFCQLVRNILSSAPRVTRFTINWDDKENSYSDAGAAASSDCKQAPSPPPGVTYTESMLEDIHQALGEPSKESFTANRDSSGPLCSSVLNSDNISSNPQPSNNGKSFTPCLENSIDAMEAQMLVE